MTDLTFPEPIRILSDLHLGHIACALKDVRQIRPLLEGARTVIFNGDTAEIRAKSFRQRAVEEQAKLTIMLAELGVERVVYVTGNHDSAISDVHHLSLMQGKVIVTHGDFLYRYISPWSHKLRHCRPLVDAILAETDLVRLERDFDYRLEITRKCCEVMTIIESPKQRSLLDRAKYFSKEFWPPTRIFTILNVWLTAPSQIRSALAQYHPEAHTMIFGHIHRPGVWQRKGRIAINTGGFLSVLRASVINIEGQNMTYHAVEQRGGDCVLGSAQCISTEQLPSPPR